MRVIKYINFDRIIWLPKIVHQDMLLERWYYSLWNCI